MIIVSVIVKYTPRMYPVWYPLFSACSTSTFIMFSSLSTSVIQYL
jgi:hypothetical protein